MLKEVTVLQNDADSHKISRLDHVKYLLECIIHVLTEMKSNIANQTFFLL